MDEGGFVLDYVMPAGSSLAGNRPRARPCRAILRATPEVESTSRRTGLELGLAAVTEPNTGDIAVKLKANRRRSIDEMISDVRAKVTREEPALDVEFIQVLQDMIGDLTGAPEPIVVKLFSPDADLLSTWAPRGRRRARQGDDRRRDAGRRRRGRHREHHQRAGRRLQRQSGGRAARGFTPRNSARWPPPWSDGEPAVAPVIVNDRPYPLRVRFPESARASLEAMSNTLLVSAAGRTATLGSLTRDRRTAGPDRDPPGEPAALVEVTARPRRRRPGHGDRAVQKAIADLKLPPSIRVEYGGTYQEQQKSFRDLAIVLVLALVLDLPGAAVRVPIVHARRSRSSRRRCCRRRACSSRCWSRGRRSTCRRSWG